MLYKAQSKLISEKNMQINITRTRESYCTAHSNAFHCVTGYITCRMIDNELLSPKNFRFEHVAVHTGFCGEQSGTNF
jgi:hypothetical protein